MLFIAHQLPKGLLVDEVITLGEHGTKMTVAGRMTANEKGDAPILVIRSTRLGRALF